MLDYEKSSDIMGKINVDTFGKFKVYNTSCMDLVFKSRSDKQCKLLQYLLVNGNRSLSVDNIIENVYSENYYSDAKNTLQNNIYRLRKSLKECHIFNTPKKGLEYESGCYTLRIDDRFKIDFIKFENEISKGCSCSYNSKDSLECLENAYNIYKGDFLPNLVSEEWAIFKRNHFSRLYIRCIKELCERYFSAKRYDEAIKTCENALNFEPYEEEIHVKFIDAFVKKGNYRAAKKHYSYVTKLFYEQFNISPSERMQLTYRDIKEKNGNHDAMESGKDSSDEENQGAHYCNIEELATIYRVEKKRERRTGNSNILFSFSYSGDFDNMDKFRIKKILMSSLREGDLVSKVEEQKYVVYLVGAEFDTIKKVLERIVRRIKSRHQLDKGAFTIGRYYLK
ncbi:DNA-binding transcriptional activator of the SARP family [Dethiosulfatibacter aminovorans DSM 17477]|uniref:DNA-binding transcriptional activator of the SARP family n=1 Tax=Dethiosulfatibacter aminovorans DSM 17477 TaxID=1121476 RepID=A0A1M6B0N0_9FIRM|nr:BTAD domain-containing putative transcriptional regulator [Dethiosulfatibacter aminovorans]SHI42023.1 DNA-binding transcriptional activator of the SARP family [Dethiosulfatibacter aminovorans DSM 17477]